MKPAQSKEQRQEKATLDFLGRLASAKTQCNASNAKEYRDGYQQQKTRYAKKWGQQCP